MANEKHLDILKTGIREWNNWREENPQITPDLSGADLSGFYLFRGDLNGANLGGCNLSRASLIGANLSRTNLIRCNLYGCNLLKGNLHGTNLNGGNLSGGDLSGADLFRANMFGVNLTGAMIAPNIRAISLLFDPRGYALIPWYREGQLTIKAGCYDFLPAEAIAHWSSPNYPEPERGVLWVKFINLVAEMLPEKIEE